MKKKLLRKVRLLSAASIAAALAVFILSGRENPYYANINGRRVTLEIASDPQSRANGLMFRDSLDRDSGMLFVFPEPRNVSFWMKNTYIPLDIAFIDENERIVKTARMEPLSEERVASGVPVLYALEVNAGFFRKHGIGEGDEVEFSEAVTRIVPE